MKITLTDVIYCPNEKFIKLTLLINNKQHCLNLQIKQYQGIEYIPYGDEVFSILMLNFNNIKNFNNIIEKIKKGELISLPFDIGEF